MPAFLFDFAYAVLVFIGFVGVLLVLCGWWENLDEKRLMRSRWYAAEWSPTCSSWVASGELAGTVGVGSAPDRPGSFDGPHFDDAA